ncbi:MAG: DUF4870 domain-containing protein [Blastocatellia bacterium]|jgi:hypothetical protein
MVTKEERSWGILLHLSGLTGLVFPFGNLIAPLVLWLIRKDHSVFLDDQGREALNFQISFSIYVIVSAVLMLLLIGFVLLPLVLITGVVLMIIAGIRVNEGTWYRYPGIFRLL